MHLVLTQKSTRKTEYLPTYEKKGETLPHVS